MIERKAFFLLNLVWIAAFPVSWWLGTPWPALVALVSWIPVFDRSRRSPFLPSLMYHSVSDHYHRFPKSELSVSLRSFRWAMAWLKLRGYRTLSFAEAEAFTRGERFPGRCVHLTFDDGYLDNWVNAWPVLRELGLTGTVFVTDEFIERDGAARPVRRPEDGDRELDEWGFMNEAELVAAAESGVYEFLPHGRTHTWHPCADELVGFHRPGDRLVWLDWNLRPDRKARWITEFPQGFAREGWPVLKHGKSLEVRRFIVDDGLLEAFADEAAAAGISSDRDALEALWADFRGRHPVIGRMESEAEWMERLRDELGSTKRYLERLLGKPCDYFCWPGGGKQAESLAICYEELGYRMSTTHQYGEPNRHGRPDRWLYRVGGGYSLRFDHPVWNTLRFVGQLETTRRNYCWIAVFALGHAVEGLAARLGRLRRRRDRVLAAVGMPTTRR